MARRRIRFRTIEDAIRDRDKALAQWTTDRKNWLAEKQALRKQIRDLERVLFKYLKGDA